MHGPKSQDIMEKAIQNLLEQNHGLSENLRTEEDKLRAIQCANPDLGRYLYGTELSAIVDIFQGPQECFDRHYPHMSGCGFDERIMIAKNLEAHAVECEHCKTKIAHDADWKMTVDAAFETAKV